MNSPFNLRLPVAFGGDHAGFSYKAQLIAFLEKKEFPYLIWDRLVKLQLIILILHILLHKL